MRVSSEGSVRVDLVGGTIDLEPINLILKDVVTLNVATSLKAKVTIDKTNFDGVEIYSHDYQKNYQFHFSDLTADNLFRTNQFQEMTFVLQILKLFGPLKNIKLELSSGAPAGSGLGGSSAMGVTLFKAMSLFTDQPFDIKKTVMKVKSVESRILNQGVAGYQDYFPALTGGVLAIRGVEGDIEIEQLYTNELKNYLEQHLTLVYSGQSRASGINNWEVYKGFFDKKKEVVHGLNRIAEISSQTYQAIKDKNYKKVIELIALEGVERELLFPAITTEKIKELMNDIKLQNDHVGIKMCGAGGGGCFLLTSDKPIHDILSPLLQKHQMRKLDFSIDQPLHS